MSLNARLIRADQCSASEKKKKKKKKIPSLVFIGCHGTIVTLTSIRSLWPHFCQNEIMCQKKKKKKKK